MERNFYPSGQLICYHNYMKHVSFSTFISKKPIIGMVHLAPLVGEPGYMSMAHVVQYAIQDIHSLQQGGIDGILVENWYANGTTPFVLKKTAVCMKHVLEMITPQTHVPWGINVLHNDYPLAFALAYQYHAQFVQLDVFVDHVKSAFLYSEKAKSHPFEIHPDPVHIQQCAKKAGNMPFIVFIQPKHYTMLEKNKSLVISANESKRFGASGVIITKATGIAPEVKKIAALKRALGAFPVGVGSGVTTKTVKQFLSAGDFCIVGTALKEKGDIYHPVDSIRVARLMTYAHAEN